MLRYADGFSIYGTGATGKTNMLRGAPWSEAASTGPSTANPASASLTHHYRVTSLTGTSVPNRMAFGGNYTSFGIGGYFYLSILPEDNDNVYLMQIRDSANAAQCTLVVGSTGTLILTNGDRTGTVLATSATTPISAGAWVHVEAFFTIANASPGGSIEVRVNGVSVLTASGVDTQGTANAGAEQMVFGRVASPDSCVLDFTSIHFWDTVDDGTGNDDFLGQVQWLPWTPTADTAITDFVRNTGSNDFDAIDDTTPDDDTTYIAGANVGDKSQFGMSDGPAATSEVVGIVMRTLAKKTDAGACSIMGTLVQTAGSPDTEQDGNTNAISTTYAYYTDVFQKDPATSARFTLSGLNSAQWKITKAA